MRNKCKLGLGTALAVVLATTVPTYAEVGHFPVQSLQFEFKLKPQSLQHAIRHFTKITGLNVIGDGALPTKVLSGEVSGTLRAGDALQQILSGTDISLNSPVPQPSFL